VICVIPARGGSQRIFFKNIRLFHGKPIIAYSIELGLYNCYSTIVSTDSKDIAAVAREYGAQVHERPPALARDEIGTQEVARGVIEDLALTGTICVLYATSPLLTNANISRAEKAHFNDPAFTFRYSADYMGETTGGFCIGQHNMFHLEPYAYGLPWPTEDIDINTPEDWSRAEKLYEEIHHGN